MRAMIWSVAVMAAAVLAGPAVAASNIQEVPSPGASKFQDKPFRTDTLDIFLAAKGSRADKLEYMIRMKAGDVVSYTLTVPQADSFYHELHGHTGDKVTFYKKAEGATHHGSVIAPFDGLHGWYLENRTEGPVVARIQLSGFYELIPPGEEGNEVGAEPGAPPFVQ